MSAVKNKNNIKMWTTDNHKQRTTQTAHYREHRSDGATKNGDRSWPIHPNARHVSRKAHTAKKKKKNIYIYNLLSISPLQNGKMECQSYQQRDRCTG